MLKTKMYVRCPADQESMYEPRIFVCGQIINIDEFKRTVSVKVHDPFGHLLFFEDLPKGVIELPLGSVDRCSFFIGSIVVYKGSSYKVLSCQKCKDDYYKYYIQNFDDTSVVKVPEADVIAAFNNGQVDPCVQLKNYEFQNPAWYLGRAVVAKSMDILENSIYGFKELAGSKIYLMPHQVNTIMRCLQESPCRYMLADEVGMGKTIEAISVYKIYTMNQSNKKALIVVPQVLKEQWISELLLKFNIPNGMGKNNNSVTVKTLQELSEKDLFTDWDFVIVDEVHKYLFSQSEYEKLHKISTLAKNILLLSATPVQQKKEEYLDLLRLLLPQKYNSFSVEKFGKLIAKQSKIIQKTALILDDLGDFEEEINSLAESAHDSEECEELFEEIHEDLEEICDELDDDKLNELLQQIKYENDDLGVYTIKVIISYICSNYQIESNIIRNRRKILESTGIIQPVKEIGEKLQERGILFHIDATQSCGKLVEEIRSIKYDMLSFSAHKLMGPQGVGVLVLRKKSYKFPPVKAILYGGQQERGIRPGTLPVALVAGCGKACEIAESEYQRNIKHSQDLKNELLTVLDESGIQYHFNGEQNYCVPSTLNICIDGVSSEALMISTKQFCGVSNGSACTSKSYSPSYVLVAMGIATEQIESSIRISWGPNTDKEDALHNFKALLEIAKQIKS